MKTTSALLALALPVIGHAHTVDSSGLPMDKEMLRAHLRGLVASSACMGGVVSNKVWQQQRGECGKETVASGDMFDDFHVQDHVELLARGGEVFGGGVAVIDGQPGLFGMKLRHGNVPGGGIRPDHAGPQPCHRFAQQPAAAADSMAATASGRITAPTSAPRAR